MRHRQRRASAVWCCLRVGLGFGKESILRVQHPAGSVTDSGREASVSSEATRFHRPKGGLILWHGRRSLLQLAVLLTLVSGLALRALPVFAETAPDRARLAETAPMGAQAASVPGPCVRSTLPHGALG